MSRLPLPNGGLQHSSSSYNSSTNRPDSPGQSMSPAMDTRKKQSKRDEVSLILIPIHSTITFFPFIYPSQT